MGRGVESREKEGYIHTVEERKAGREGERKRRKYWLKIDLCKKSCSRFEERESGLELEAMATTVKTHTHAHTQMPTNSHIIMHSR